ncbi:MAG: ABC transporter ATP-binding protein [Flavobacteriaceae bacterium]|jgi:ABC-type multidrug transport system ATPase subunit|nr:ABC transporter ATP-binding protein [Flavobacteriaceae bacterium]
MISIKNISKIYKFKNQTITALDDISLEISKGELFGLIGPDGAGKTSLFRILTTLIEADSGEASVMGFDVKKDFMEIRQKVGYMPGRFSLYQDLSIIENLNFFADIFGTTVKANYDLIRDIYAQIEPFKNRRAGQLSGGMKQKLALCCTLVHKPEVLFLDEPTTGVDPVSRREFWTILRKLNEDGMTIVVSTPYMDEASLCQRIALIQEGKILSVDTPQNIENKYENKVFAVKSENKYQLLKDFRKRNEVNSVYMFGEFLHVTFKENKIPDNLDDNLNIKEIKPGIEDCFIGLMKNTQQ